VYHAQAQALIGGAWVWLQTKGEVFEGERETNFTPERTVTIEEAQTWR
jgi:hypothetical protein